LGHPVFCNALQVDVCTEGASLLPLLKSNVSLSWKSAAFSQTPRMQGNGNVLMGYSMRTHRYRYTEWVLFDYATSQPWWSRFIFSGLEAELYDHATDPQENVNVAEDRLYVDIRSNLSSQLRSGWRTALPSKSSTTSSDFYFDTLVVLLWATVSYFEPF